MGEPVSDQQQPPPPGWQPPPAPPPGYGPPPAYGAPGYGAPGYGPGWMPPMVHKPGVVALRPLSLGDLYDGAFKTIRRNPGAMLGLSFLVCTAFMVVPTLITLGLAAAGNLAFALSDSGSGFDTGLASLMQDLGSLFGSFATVILNGVVMGVVGEAVLGRRTTIGQAWARVRDRVSRLIGLLLLDIGVAAVLFGVAAGIGLVLGFQVGLAEGLLVGIPLGIAALVGFVFLQVRYFLLAPAALVLERTTVFAALRRAGELSRAQWWRLFGIQLLTALVVGLVSEVVAVPLAGVALAGGFLLDGTVGALVFVFASYLSQILVGALTTPFTSSVTALQYVDQRIRKEALDVELIAASQRMQPMVG